MEQIGWSRRALAIVSGLCLAVVALIGGGLLLVRGWPGFVLAALGLALAGLLVWGLLQLRRVDPSGWTITWDVPEPLQLAGYVGAQEGFRVDAAPATPGEREWQAWWQLLPERIWAHQSALDDLLHAEVGLGPGALMQSLGGGLIPGADEPNFGSLRGQPALQALCRQHWPGFAAEWAAGKPAIIRAMGRQGAAVREERAVHEAARAAHKATVAPFLLRIDFVRWPADYRELRSDGHLLLGVDYLEAGAAGRLRAIIRDAVVPLV